MRHQPSPVSTHPKQGNPSKIRAQRVATWLAEPLPFGTFEPPKSKGGRVKQGALASSRHWLGERNGPSKNTSQPPASPVSTHPKQGNPSKIHAHRVATRSAEPLPFGTFEPPKSKGGRVKQGALASSRHWLGERNGPEQHRAASAVPKARHSPQRHP